MSKTNRHKSRNGSSRNYTNANMTMNIIQKLLHQRLIVFQHITIMSYYRAQQDSPNILNRPPHLFPDKGLSNSTHKKNRSQFSIPERSSIDSPKKPKLMSDDKGQNLSPSTPKILQDSGINRTRNTFLGLQSLLNPNLHPVVLPTRNSMPSERYHSRARKMQQTHEFQWTLQSLIDT